MSSSNSKRFLLLIIPLLLLKPFWEFIKQINYAFWEVFREAIAFFETNPLITLLIIIILFLLSNRNGG